MPEPLATDRERLVDMLKRAKFLERTSRDYPLKDHEFHLGDAHGSCLNVGGGYPNFHTVIDFNDDGSIRSWGSYE